MPHRVTHAKSGESHYKKRLSCRRYKPEVFRMCRGRRYFPTGGFRRVRLGTGPRDEAVPLEDALVEHVVANLRSYQGWSTPGGLESGGSGLKE